MLAIYRFWLSVNGTDVFLGFLTMASNAKTKQTKNANGYKNSFILVIFVKFVNLVTIMQKLMECRLTIFAGAAITFVACVFFRIINYNGTYFPYTAIW